MSDTTVDSLVDSILGVETETVQIPMFDNTFSRRGKAASGNFTIPCYGKAVHLDNGITRELGYGHCKGYSNETVIAIAELEGYTLAELVLAQIDTLRQENNGMGNLLKTTTRKIILAGISSDEKSAEKLAKSYITTADTMNMTVDAVIENRAAAAATTRTTTEIKPRLVDNRK
jgi:hypothetical protein